MLRDKLGIDKSSKVILISLLVYLIVVLAIFLPSYLKNKREKLYIATNNYQIKYEYGKWDNLAADEFINKKFNVYVDNIYKGNYNVFLDKKLYLYEKKDNLDLGFLEYNGRVFTYSGSIPLKIFDYNRVDKGDSDILIISDVLSKIGVNNITNFSTFEKIELDVDNDGQVEYLYNISNFYDETGEQKVSLLFIYDDEVRIIEKSITDSIGVYSNPSYEISNIVDIRNDKSLELIYFENYYSKPDESCLKIYDLKKFKEINNFCK